MFCCAKRPATAYDVEDVYVQPVQQQPVAPERPAQAKPAVPAHAKAPSAAALQQQDVTPAVQRDAMPDAVTAPMDHREQRSQDAMPRFEDVARPAPAPAAPDAPQFEQQRSVQSFPVSEVSEDSPRRRRADQPNRSAAAAAQVTPAAKRSSSRAGKMTTPGSGSKVAFGRLAASPAPPSSANKKAAPSTPEFSPSVLRPTKASIARAEQVASMAAAGSTAGAAADGRWKY